MGSGCSKASTAQEKASAAVKQRKPAQQPQKAKPLKARGEEAQRNALVESEGDGEAKSSAKAPVPALQRGESEAARQPRRNGLAFDFFGALPRIERIGIDKFSEILGVLEASNREREPMAGDFREALLKGDLKHPSLTDSRMISLLTSRVVRFFFSSTFVDTETERNLFLEDCAPFLRELASHYGLQFHVSEMRWGVNEVLSTSHQTSVECMRELDRCVRESLGLAFVGLLGNRYGYRPFPNEVAVDLFQQLVDQVRVEEGCWQLLEQWFERDDNREPPIMVLKPMVAEEDLDDADKKQAAEAAWWGQYFNALQLALRSAARSLQANGSLSCQDADPFIRSVTAEEMFLGIELEAGKHGGVAPRSALVLRDIKASPAEAAEYVQQRQYARHVDVVDGKVDAESAELMAALKSKLRQMVRPERCKAYEVQWAEHGFSPSHDEHRRYMTEFCEDVVRMNVEALAEGIRRVPVMSALVAEVLNHTLLAKARADGFFGRSDAVASVRSFLLGEGATKSNTMLVTGASGTGKSALCARVVSSLADYDAGANGAVLLRFVGSTQSSSDARNLLHSLFDQLSAIREARTGREQRERLKQSLVEGGEQLASLMRFLASPETPLMIVLDGVDGFGEWDEGRDLSWFPLLDALPDHCRVVLSFESGRAATLEARMVDGGGARVELGALSAAEGSELVLEWLRQRARRLAPQQLELVRAAMESAAQHQESIELGATPLFAMLMHEMAKGWKSTTRLPPAMPTSCAEAADMILTQLEKLHEPKLVRLVLCGMCVANQGLTVSELEDLVSCNDGVLLALFQWWVPPYARVPPLQIVRLISQIESLLTGGGQGGRVGPMRWQHKMVEKAVRARYLGGSGEVEAMCREVADLFTGESFRNQQPLEVQMKGKTVVLPKNRLLPEQKVVLGMERPSTGRPTIRWNTRMLIEGPWLLLGAKKWSDLAAFIAAEHATTFFLEHPREYELARYWREVEEKTKAAAGDTEGDGGGADAFGEESVMLQRYCATLDSMSGDAMRLRRYRFAFQLASFVQVVMGRWDEAQQLAERALADATQGMEAEEADKQGMLALAKQQASDPGFLWPSTPEEDLERGVLDWQQKVAEAQKLLADILDTGGQFAKALEMYDKCSASCVDHTSSFMAIVLANSASTHFKMGHTKEAIEITRKALEGHRQVREASGEDKESEKEGETKLNLGLYLMETGEYEEAVKTMEESIAVLRRCKGGLDLDVAGALSNLGIMLRRLNRLDEAAEKYEEALRVRVEWLGPKHLKVAETLMNKGVLYLGRDSVQARKCFQEAYEIQVQQMGADHPAAAATLCNISMVDQIEGKLADAQEKVERALAVHRQSFGTNHMTTALDLHTLGVLHHEQAEQGGVDTEKMVLFLNKLAGIESAQQNEEAATALLLEGLERTIKTFGLDHIKVADQHDLISSSFKARQMWVEALDHALDNIRIREMRLPAEDLSIAGAKYNTGNTLLGMGEGYFEKALDLFRQAAAVFKTALPPSHSVIPQTWERIVFLCNTLGKDDKEVAEATAELDAAKLAAGGDAQ